MQAPIKVYVRSTSKKAFLLQIVPQQTIPAQILPIISRRLHLPMAMNLYYNGRKIENDKALPYMQPHSIIHAVNTQNIPFQIKIRIIPLRNAAYQLVVSRDTVIGDAIDRYIHHQEEKDKLFLVYVGRQLSKSSTFYEECVQNQSEIYCLHQEKDRKDRRETNENEVSKYQQNAVNENQSPYTEKNSSSCMSLEEISFQNQKNKSKFVPLSNLSELPTKLASSFIQQPTNESQPNFKKKNQIPSMQPQNHSTLLFEPQRSAFQDNSISAIVDREQFNNPQHTKKEGNVLFASVDIGTFNQSYPSIESEHAQNAEGSFDNKAPQLIDKRLTCLSRQQIQEEEDCEQEIKQYKNQYPAYQEQYDSKNQMENNQIVQENLQKIYKSVEEGQIRQQSEEMEPNLVNELQSELDNLFLPQTNTQEEEKEEENGEEKAVQKQKIVINVQTVKSISDEDSHQEEKIQTQPQQEEQHGDRSQSSGTDTLQRYIPDKSPQAMLLQNAVTQNSAQTAPFMLFSPQTFLFTTEKSQPFTLKNVIHDLLNSNS